MLIDEFAEESAERLGRPAREARTAILQEVKAQHHMPEDHVVRRPENNNASQDSELDAPVDKDLLTFVLRIHDKRFLPGSFWYNAVLTARINHIAVLPWQERRPPQPPIARARLFSCCLIRPRPPDRHGGRRRPKVSATG